MGKKISTIAIADGRTEAGRTGIFPIANMHAQKAFDLGVAYLESDEFDMALLAFNEAVRLDATLAQAYNGRSVVYGLKNCLDKALADSNEAIRLAPDDPEFYRTRAYLFQQRGEDALAEADLAAADRLERGLG